MFSPLKLYKHDMQHQNKRVTWGPRGRPYKRPLYSGMGITIKDNASLCYRHPNADWTFHRLVPYALLHHRDAGSSATASMSPRWGEGKAPSRRGRRVVPFPKSHDIQASKRVTHSAAVGVGVVAAAGAGYYAYRHREGIKKRVHKLESSFHQSHLAHKLHMSGNH